MISCLFNLATWITWMIVYIYIMLTALAVGALLWIGRRVSLRGVHWLHYALLTVHSCGTLVTPQCNPTMCNRTSCVPSAGVAINPLW